MNSEVPAMATPATVNYVKFTNQEALGKFLVEQYHIRTPAGAEQLRDMSPMKEIAESGDRGASGRTAAATRDGLAGLHSQDSMQTPNQSPNQEPSQGMREAHMAKQAVEGQSGIQAQTQKVPPIRPRGRR